MEVITLSHIAKSFGTTQAVEDVSFEIKRGQIFGLLGPNGAGKTTSIRILLDIYKPDRGQVSILGGPMTEAKKEKIGYMPEERGLYQDVALEDCQVYLATLKGLPRSEARRRLAPHLDRFDLAAHKRKKVKDLSKGMQQKAQIINTLLHKPEVLIIDEPFTALDPLNTQLVKDVLLEQRDQGATILMSTHMMHQVEELCDKIVLINQGKDVLHGKVNEIRRRFASDALVVQIVGNLPRLEGVSDVTQTNGGLKLTLAQGMTPQAVLESLVAARVPLEKFEVALPTLDEVFIRVVREGEN